MNSTKILNWRKNEFKVPMLVYRRFVYLLSTAILYIPKLEHGHLRFAFEFKENEDGNWQDKFKMDFIAEKTIPRWRSD
ncbi:hypothetical protein OL548_34670 (plasmid) [Lysinibacillus sp. MHQ-1]|nr:hypothetical protein OL548_34670 [Lysinibacillus sp. MHQ-1]